jgi:hypothetical protein
MDTSNSNSNSNSNPDSNSTNWKIVSIDIGIINFAFCVMERQTRQILNWECFGLCNTTELENCKDLVQKLDARPYLIASDIRFVIIERQPRCNNKMRILAETVRTYFLIRGIVDHQQSNMRILNWSPKYKLKCYSGDDTPDYSHLKSKYSQRKKISIFHCEKLLVSTNQSESFLKTFKDSKKKDDLADCFLQVLSFVQYSSACNER